MNMNGKDLRLAVRNSGIKVAELSKKTGIEERTFFNLYKKEIVEDHYLEKIEKAGVKLKKTENSSSVATPELTAQIIGMVQQTIDQVNKSNDHLIEVNQKLTNMLEKVIGSNPTTKPAQPSLQEIFSNNTEYRKALKFVGGSPDGVSICVTDAEGRIIYVNDEFTKQTGYTLEEMKGRKPGKVLQRDNTDQEEIRKIRTAIKNHKYFEGEILNYAKDGTEIVCKLTLSPIKDKHGKIEKFISLAVFSKVNVLKYN